MLEGFFGAAQINGGLFHGQQAGTDRTTLLALGYFRGDAFGKSVKQPIEIESNFQFESLT